MSAKDLGTGRSQAIQVTAVERPVARPRSSGSWPRRRSHAEADRARRELVDLRNQADGLVYSTERTLEEFKENVSAEQRQVLLARDRDDARGAPRPTTSARCAPR